MTRRRLHAEPRRFWTPTEDATLRARFADEPTAALARELGRTYGAVARQARALGLRKSAAYLASPAAGRLGTRGQGVASRFRPGQTPANEGLRGRRGWAPGRMADGQFKPGHGRSGIAARVYKPVGTERVSKDGYRERKINNDLPLQKRWRAVHLLVWEAANGPLPRGHAVVFKNGDRTDVRLENLECITRQQLMARNTVHNLPAPLPEMVQLLGALTAKINRRARAAQEQSA